MKKITALVVCAIMLLTVCSCGKSDNVGTYKEPDNYNKASSDAYTIKYDDNVFEFVKSDGFDYLARKDVETDDYHDYFIVFTQYPQSDEYARAEERERIYKENGYVDISTDVSQTLEGALCVSALSDDGDMVYETQIVALDDGAFEIEYQYSTSLDEVALSDTIYSIVSTFKLK